MGPQQNEVESVIAPLKKATPLSKYFAMVLFVILPFLGGYIGYQLAPVAKVVVDKNVQVFTKNDVAKSLKDNLQLVALIADDDARVLDVANGRVLIFDGSSSSFKYIDLSDMKEINIPSSLTSSNYYGGVYDDYILLSELDLLDTFEGCNVGNVDCSTQYGTTTIVRRSDGAVLHTMSYTCPTNVSSVKFVKGKDIKNHQIQFIQENTLYSTTTEHVVAAWQLNEAHDAYVAVDPSLTPDRVTPDIKILKWRPIEGITGSTTIEWHAKYAGRPEYSPEKNILDIKSTKNGISKVISIPLLDNYETSEVIMHTVKPNNGVVWFATSYGLLAFDVNTSDYKLYTKNEGLVSNIIHDIWFDKNGIIIDSGRGDNNDPESLNYYR